MERVIISYVRHRQDNLFRHTVYSLPGNRLLHNLTSSRNYSLRVDMEDFEGNTSYAVYSQFTVGSEDDGFRLTAGGYSGTAG